MLIVIFWISWINKYIINEDNDKLITANMRKLMLPFENILRACIDEIILFDFRSNLPLKANSVTSIGLKVTLRLAVNDRATTS